MKKKLISIIGLFLLCAMLFCGCDVPVDLDMDETDATAKGTEKQTEEQTEKPTEKATENKKPSKEPENEQNKEPEKVGQINGKSASQIVEKFFEDYASAQSFDMILNTCEIFDDVPYETHMELKISGGDIYMLMNEDGFDMEIWGVDGMLYVDNDGEKLKAEADINDYFGEGFVEMLVANVPTKLHRIYKNKLDAAEITSNGISYSFTVTFSYEEALEMAEDDEIEEEVCGFSETYVVGTDGRVKAILSDYENGSCSSVEFNSYGKSVKISAPINPDDFEEVEIDDGGEDDWGDYDGEVDPEAYALYYDLCVLLKSADSYDVLISQDEESLANYTFTGDNKYVMGLGYSRFEAWIVDDRAYAISGGSFSVINEAVTDGFYEYYFESIEEYLTYAYEWNDIEWISYIYSYEDDFGNLVIDFEVSRGGNFFDKYYTYTISNEGRTIEVDIWYFSGEDFMGSMYYRFDCINDPDLTIVAPL